MANMSYCRFRNTLSHLQECQEAASMLEAPEDLPEEERKAAARLIKMCTELAQDFEDFFE